MHADEHEELVTYLGRSVPKKGFRAYIFATDGRKKIAESWDEFDLYTHSDEWFATQEEAKPAKPEAEAPKKPRKKTEE